MGKNKYQKQLTNCLKTNCHKSYHPSVAKIEIYIGLVAVVQ